MVAALLFAARRVNENVLLHLIGLALVGVEIPQPIIVESLVALSRGVEQKLSCESVRPHPLARLGQTLATEQDEIGRAHV